MNSVNAVDPNVIGVAPNIPNFWFANDTSEQTSKITNISGQNSPHIRITLSFSTNSHLHAAHCNPNYKKSVKKRNFVKSLSLNSWVTNDESGVECGSGGKEKQG